MSHEAATQAARQAMAAEDPRMVRERAQGERAAAQLNANAAYGHTITYAGIYGGEHRWTDTSPGGQQREVNARDLQSTARYQRVQNAEASRAAAGRVKTQIAERASHEGVTRTGYQGALRAELARYRRGDATLPPVSVAQSGETPRQRLSRLQGEYQRLAVWMEHGPGHRSNTAPNSGYARHLAIERGRALAREIATLNRRLSQTTTRSRSSRAKAAA